MERMAWVKCSSIAFLIAKLRLKRFGILLAKVPDDILRMMGHLVSA